MCGYVINASQRRPHNYRNNSFTTERTVWYHVPRRCYYAVGSMVSCINPVKNFGLRLSLFLRLTWPTAPTWRRTGKVEAPQGPKVPMPPVPGEHIGLSLVSLGCKKVGGLYEWKMLSPVFESQEQEVSCLQVEQEVQELQSRETENAAKGFNFWEEVKK